MVTSRAEEVCIIFGVSFLDAVPVLPDVEFKIGTGFKFRLQYINKRVNTQIRNVSEDWFRNVLN